MNSTKLCNKCQEEKELNQFSKCSRNKDGLLHTCKSCKSALYFETKEKYSDRRKQYNKNNAEHKREYDLGYRAENTAYYRRLKQAWELSHSNDPINKIKKNMRRRLHHALNGHLKAQKTFDLVGCNAEDLKVRLESQFKTGMSWENYGLGNDKWHIHRIRPCSSFDLSKPSEQKKCFHFSNLQPLWQVENLTKSDKF